MTKEFRKQTEEAKFEAFSLMCKKVADLEAEVKEWKAKADLWCKTANLKDHNIMINKELEKENAELQHKIDTLQGFLDRDVEFDNLQKENAELKHQLAHRNCLDCSNHSSNLRMRNLELEKENAELKEKVNILDNCDRLGDVITEAYKDQLTKAKELLERLLITSCNSDVLNLLPNCSEVLRVRVEAEQFLSEVKN